MVREEKLNELRYLVTVGNEFSLKCKYHEYDLSQWVDDSGNTKISIVDEEGRAQDFDNVNDLFDNLMVDGIPLKSMADYCEF